MDGETFTVPYFTDTIPNSPAGYQLTTQDTRDVWIIAVNG